MPKLHSSRSHFEDVAEVAAGIKPVSLVSEQAMLYGKQLGLGTTKVPKGSFTVPALVKNLAYVVYPKSQKNRATRILNIFKKYPLSKGPRPIQYHIELGRALGYPEEDISYFIRKFL